MTDVSSIDSAPASLPNDLTIATPSDVEHEQTVYVHEAADYCARDTDGRVVVGVTNDSGEVLVLDAAGGDHAILPNCHVEDGDWEGVARETVANSTGVQVLLDGVRFVRCVDHRLEDEEDARERTYHVVFGASPVSEGGDAADPACADPEWTAGWYDAVPVEFEDEDDDVLADIERFLD